MADISMLKTVNNVGSFTFKNANPILLPNILKPSQKNVKSIIQYRNDRRVTLVSESI